MSTDIERAIGSFEPDAPPQKKRKTAAERREELWAKHQYKAMWQAFRPKPRKKVPKLTRESLGWCTDGDWGEGRGSRGETDSPAACAASQSFHTAEAANRIVEPDGTVTACPSSPAPRPSAAPADPAAEIRSTIARLEHKAERVVLWGLDCGDEKFSRWFQNTYRRASDGSIVPKAPKARKPRMNTDKHRFRKSNNKKPHPCSSVSICGKDSARRAREAERKLMFAVALEDCRASGLGYSSLADWLPAFRKAPTWDKRPAAPGRPKRSAPVSIVRPDGLRRTCARLSRVVPFGCREHSDPGAPLANKRLRIEVRGAVQGVGFRPAVWRHATELALSGFVTNDSSGVVVEVEGPAAGCEAFARRLRESPPPAAVIREFTVLEVAPLGRSGFEIRESSAAAETYISIPPDLAVCTDCRRELFDPSDRRYRYPFTNCTNCGPRFTITRTMPYDRPQTTMSGFPLCADCAREYSDPADRRFHAQPVACPKCGPRAWLETPGGRRADGDAAIAMARELLGAGKILAVRGLGGFHLACDALNPEVVARLRERKERPSKPLAVMCPDLAAAESLVELTEDERGALTSPLAPIVIARARLDEPAASASRWLAPGNSRLGVMLAYTPLHALLFEPAVGLKGAPARFTALVMTSGNRRDEPICRTNEEAREYLSGIADAWLLHDRPIHNRADDSILAFAGHGPLVIRRSRGMAPRPVRLAEPARRTVLALGAEMKGSFCLLRGREAYLSQYLGELDEAGNAAFYREAAARLVALGGEPPAVLARDLHPDYFTTQLAADWPRGLESELAAAGLKPLPAPEQVVAVQHHHAHALSVLAELGPDAPERSLGIILDGTGWGGDGTIWGGELLLLTESGARFERLAHLAPLRLAGGDRAAREPWRPALALALEAHGGALPAWLEQRFTAAAGGADSLGVVRRMLERGFNSPLSSSAGRLFDAVGFLVTGRAQADFEAQAAIELESLAEGWSGALTPYDFEVRAGAGTGAGSPCVLDTLGVARSIAADIAAGRPAGEIAAAFHLGLVRSLAALAARLAARAGFGNVILSGGCFQNRVLLGALGSELEGRGLGWYANRQAPANDGGVALGQALAAALLTKGG